MRAIIILLSGMSILLLGSCGAKQKLTNYHFGKYSYDSISYSKVLKIRVSTLSIPKQTIIEEKAKSFFDLRDSVPNRFLIEIGAKSTKPEDIINAIKSPLSEVGKKTESTYKFVDASEFKIRFLFSNIKKYYTDKRFLHPNTRIEILNTKLDIIGDLYSIKEIDKIENEIDFIDFGTLEREHSVKFGSKLNASLSSTITGEGNSSSSKKMNEGTTSNYNNSIKYGEELAIGNSNSSSGAVENLNSDSNKNTFSATNGASGELAYNNDELIKEALAFKLQRMKLGFSFDENEIELSQHGSILSDVVDNVVVTATISIDHDLTYTSSVCEIGKLYDNKTRILYNGDSLNVSTFSLKYLPCSKNINTDLKVKINAEGLLRSVKNKQHSYLFGTKGQNVGEFDDRVEYFKLKESTIPDTLNFGKSKYCKQLFKIICSVDFDGNGKPDSTTTGKQIEYLLYMKKPKYDVCKFEGGQSLSELLTWLNYAKRQTNELFFKSAKNSISFIGSNDEIILIGESINVERINKIYEIEIKDYIE